MSRTDVRQLSASARSYQGTSKHSSCNIPVMLSLSCAVGIRSGANQLTLHMGLCLAEQVCHPCCKAQSKANGHTKSQQYHNLSQHADSCSANAVGQALAMTMFQYLQPEDLAQAMVSTCPSRILAYVRLN